MAHRTGKSGLTQGQLLLILVFSWSTSFAVLTVRMAWSLLTTMDFAELPKLGLASWLLLFASGPAIWVLFVRYSTHALGLPKGHDPADTGQNSCGNSLPQETGHAR